jgi:TPR repeat protein
MKAFDWCEKSHEQGFIPATYDLGVMYCMGKGVEMDKEKAAELIKAAKENFWSEDDRQMAEDFWEQHNLQNYFVE